MARRWVARNLPCPAACVLTPYRFVLLRQGLTVALIVLGLTRDLRAFAVPCAGIKGMHLAPEVPLLHGLGEIFFC